MKYVPYTNKNDDDDNNNNNNSNINNNNNNNRQTYNGYIIKMNVTMHCEFSKCAYRYVDEY